MQNERRKPQYHHKAITATAQQSQAHLFVYANRLRAHLFVFMIMVMDTQKCMQQTDWHPADIKAALEKQGVSLRQLAKDHGYAHFARVLTTHWWAAEQIVAAALNTRPEVIWPSRYSRPRTNAQNRTSKITLTRTGRIRVMAEVRS